jgi:uncharacterized membrane protein
MIKLYFLTLTVFLAIDGLWLTMIAKNFYAKYLGYLMSKTPNLAAAGIFYLIYILALLVFVLVPAIEKNSLTQAITMGALFGLCAYATYDLTNLATIKDWPILITIVDLIWGTTLSALVAGVSFSIFKWIS